ncbi:MAG: hypothetical protein WD795_20090 [Woeseia sp.]
MRYYVMTTGAAFGLLALAHLARIILEGWHLARSPMFVVATLVSIALCFWAIYVLKQSSRRGDSMQSGQPQ